MNAPTRGKVMTAAEAVADIGDGASVGVAGFGLSHRYPSTLIAALGEKGSRGLTVYCNGLGQPGFPTGHLLADNHQIGHLVTCFSARPGVVSEAEKQIMAGEMTLEMVPQGTLVERMRAGGAGLAAIYTPTGYGSEIAEGRDERRRVPVRQAEPRDADARPVFNVRDGLGRRSYFSGRGSHARHSFQACWCCLLTCAWRSSR